MSDYENRYYVNRTAQALYKTQRKDPLGDPAHFPLVLPTKTRFGNDHLEDPVFSMSRDLRVDARFTIDSEAMCTHSKTMSFATPQPQFLNASQGIWKLP